MVGLWRDQEAEAPVRGDDGDAVTETLDDSDVEDAPRDWRAIIATALALLAAGAWLGAVIWLQLPRWQVGPPPLEEIVRLVAFVVPPLLLIGMVWAITVRGTRGTARRYEAMSGGLRAENKRLETTLSFATARLSHERAALAEANGELLSLGEEAAHRMKGVSDAMRAEIDTITRHAGALKASSAAARADVAVLLSDLPKAHVQTREMVAALETAGMNAHERVGALDALLASLTTRGREADEIAGGAAAKLAAHLSRVEGVSTTAGAALESAAATMTQAVDAALDRAAAASDAARQGMEAQGAAMLALVEQSQAALATTGIDAAAALDARVAETGERLEAMGALLAAQRDTTTALLADLKTGLDSLDAQFATLDEGGTAKSERLAAALGNLRDHATTLTASLERGTATADGLVARSETLMTALDGTVRELDETLPAAFARLDARATASQALIDRTGPEVARLGTEASSALDRLIEAEALLAKQRVALDALGTDAVAKLEAGQIAAKKLVEAVEGADTTARTLAETTGASLVDAMVRVRDTANQAAERAREAIEAVIPASAERLSEATRAALTKAIADQVEVHIASLATTAEAALATAHTASDRLMRQMLTIADTSAAVEARIADTRAEFEASDRDNFARRVALLIESLNSTAIDVTKILSNDVTDSAWAAYLRGDRGVFTRRAVRLLDGGEVREIVRHYDGEPEFREQVNRYIHDFEAMLRNTLATRDGAALSVTLLSSDMGKLYVALAQAIERLRT